MKKYNQKEYKFYVVNTDTDRIISGWEYSSDAKDHAKEMNADFPPVYRNYPVYRVYTGHHLKNRTSRRLDPNMNENWSNK